MTEEYRILWDRLVQEDGNYDDGGNKLRGYERCFAVKAADALIRSQAEQIESMREMHAFGLQCTQDSYEGALIEYSVVKRLREQIAKLASERDALAKDSAGLAAMIEKIKQDDYFRARVVQVRNGIGTDTNYGKIISEALACGSFDILAAHDAALVAPLRLPLQSLIAFASLRQVQSKRSALIAFKRARPLKRLSPRSPRRTRRSCG